MAQGEPMACTQHEFVHHGHNVTVDECVCRGDLCNKDMTYGEKNLILLSYIFQIKVQISIRHEILSFFRSNLSTKSTQWIVEE